MREASLEMTVDVACQNSPLKRHEFRLSSDEIADLFRV